MLAYPEADKLVTLIAIILPPDVQRMTMPVMSRYARAMLQWVPAHITLFSRFVSYEGLPAACEKVRAICKNIAPVEVTVAGYGYWDDGIYIPPADPTGIQHLFNAIFAEFPEYPPYGGAFGSELDPHISVAFFDDPVQTRAAELPAFEPITFVVDRINVMYGSRDVPVPLITYDVIRLGA